MTALRVFIVDDHPVVREGICSIVRSEPGMSVVGSVGSCEQALREFPGSAADVMVLDLSLPDRRGVAIIEEVRRIHPAARILALTVNDVPGTVRRAIESGALGYVLKDSMKGELVEAIQTVSRGQPYLSKRAASRLAVSFTRASLTPREFGVLENMAQGLSNKAIAANLKISEQTTKTHVRNILGKLAAKDRLEAVLVATRERLIDPGLF